MNKIVIESTKSKPGVILDPDNHFFEFVGFSLPEDATEFYVPILKCIYDYSNTYAVLVKENVQVTVNFKLTYYNSASYRAILETLQIFSNMYHKNVKINIFWYYDSDDSQMADSARELSEVSGIPIKLIEIK